MVLKDIMAISGQPGLFKFIAQGKNAIIVEHLETKRRGSAFNTARVSSLEEITIFTDNDEDMPLGKVFDLIFEKENGGPAIDFKSDPEKLKSYLGEILPQYDKEKVYNSDIRKMLQWYNILQKLNLLVKEEPETKDEAEKGKEEKPKKEKKPAKKTENKKEPETGKKKKPASPKTKK